MRSTDLKLWLTLTLITLLTIISLWRSSKVDWYDIEVVEIIGQKLLSLNGYKQFNFIENGTGIYWNTDMFLVIWSVFLVNIFFIVRILHLTYFVWEFFSFSKKMLHWYGVYENIIWRWTGHSFILNFIKRWITS